MSFQPRRCRTRRWLTAQLLIALGGAHMAIADEPIALPTYQPGMGAVLRLGGIETASLINEGSSVVSQHSPKKEIPVSRIAITDNELPTDDEQDDRQPQPERNERDRPPERRREGQPDHPRNDADRPGPRIQRPDRPQRPQHPEGPQDAQRPERRLDIHRGGMEGPRGPVRSERAQRDSNQHDSEQHSRSSSGALQPLAPDAIPMPLSAPPGPNTHPDARGNPPHPGQGHPAKVIRPRSSGQGHPGQGHPGQGHPGQGMAIQGFQFPPGHQLIPGMSLQNHTQPPVRDVQGMPGPGMSGPGMSGPGMSGPGPGMGFPGMPGMQSHIPPMNSPSHPHDPFAQLDVLERILKSPAIRQILELKEENMRLTAELKIRDAEHHAKLEQLELRMKLLLEQAEMRHAMQQKRHEPNHERMERERPFLESESIRQERRMDQPSISPEASPQPPALYEPERAAEKSELRPNR